jgi:tetratricopeptide (TPR) repeat protein
VKCPICNSVNRIEQNQCYHCNADLTLLRSVILRAKEHFNRGLEHAERGRLDEAIIELKVATSLYHDFPEAYNVLGTLYAKQEDYDSAIEQWQTSLDLDPVRKKAADYLIKAKRTVEEPVLRRKLRYTTQIGLAFAVVLAIMFSWQLRLHSLDMELRESHDLINKGRMGQAYNIAQKVSNNMISESHQILATQQLQEINENISASYQNILNMDSTGNFGTALKAIFSIRKNNLPLSWDRQFRLLQHSLLNKEIASIENDMLKVESETVDYNSLKERISFLKKLHLTPKQNLKINELWTKLQNNTAKNY